MNGDKLLKDLEKKMDNLSIKIEKLKLAEYLDVLRNTKRLLYTNFLGGLARGLGMAIGFTFLGAFVVYILQRIVVLRLPVIGKVLAEIIQITKQQLK